MSLGKLFKKLAKVAVVAGSAYATGGASLTMPGVGIGSLAGKSRGRLPGAGMLTVSNYEQQNFGAYPVAQKRSGGGQLPAVRPTTLTKDVFEAGVKLMERLGLRYTASVASYTGALKRALSAIGALARRTPSGTIISILVGLGLSVYESNLLVSWHAQKRKYRRMNPANSKALRRAARRIKSFHKLCMHTDVIKTRSRRAVGRCNSCNKNPCRC